MGVYGTHGHYGDTEIQRQSHGESRRHSFFRVRFLAFCIHLDIKSNI